MCSHSYRSAIVLLLAAFLGACGGGSDPAPATVTIGVYAGNANALPSRTIAMMEEAGIQPASLNSNLQLVDASGNNTNRYPDVLLLVGQDLPDGFPGLQAGDLTKDPVLTAVKRIYQAGLDGTSPRGHVLLLNPTKEMMSNLSAALGEVFDISASTDTRLLYYGRTRSSGQVAVIGHVDSSTVPSTYGGTPSEGATPVIAEPRERVEDYISLKNWVMETTGRTTVANGEDSKNLLKLAQTYVATLSSNLWGKAFKINNYLVAVHNFDGNGSTDGQDWFYLHQENLLDGSGGGYTFERECCWWYSRINGKYWVGGGDVVDSYIEAAYIQNRLQNNDGSVILTEPSPTAINAQTTYTTSTTHSFGSSVSGGFINGKAQGQAALTYGYNCTDSKQFTTFDVNAALETNDKVAWTYSYKGAEQSNPWYNLTHPAELSHSTYVPHQMWIWAFDTSRRPQHQTYNLYFAPRRAGVYTRNSGSISPAHVTQTGTMSLDIKLVQPPLLALEVNGLTFDRDGKETNGSKSYAFYNTQGAVTYQPNVTWLTASLASVDNKKQVAITGVQKNETGVARTGIVTLTRSGTTDTVELTITQLP